MAKSTAPHMVILKPRRHGKISFSGGIDPDAFTKASSNPAISSGSLTLEEMNKAYKAMGEYTTTKTTGSEITWVTSMPSVGWYGTGMGTPEAPPTAPVIPQKTPGELAEEELTNTFKKWLGV